MSLKRTRAVSYVGLAALLIAGIVRADTPVAKQGADAGIAAYVNGEPVTLAELDDVAIGKNMKLAQSLYDARSGALDDLILNRVLSKEAAAKVVTVDQLVAQRLAEKATPVTDADAEQYYNANKARMGSRTLDQVRGQIKSYLARNRQQSAKARLMKEIKSKQKIKVLLDVPRIKMEITDGEPIKGSPTAKVTIVEFSDFQ